MKRYIRSAVKPLADEPLDLQLEILRSSGLSPELFEKFANSKKVIKLELAKNPNTPIEILKQFSDEYANDINMQLSLSVNPSITADIIDRLSDSENERILANLAKLPNLSENAIDKLLSCDSLAVKQKLIHNPNIPNTILTKLAGDSSLPANLRAMARLKGGRR